MRPSFGLGNIPPVRRWEGQGLSGVLRSEVRGRQLSAQQLFGNTFQITAAGYGMMPPTGGSPASGLSGLGAFWRTDEADACYANLEDLRARITAFLPLLTEGIRYTAKSLLVSTNGNTNTCEQNTAIVQQVLDMAIADFKSQMTVATKTPEEVAQNLPAGSQAREAIKELEKVANPTMKYVGIGAAVLGGLLLVGLAIAMVKGK